MMNPPISIDSRLDPGMVNPFLSSRHILVVDPDFCPSFIVVGSE